MKPLRDIFELFVKDFRGSKVEIRISDQYLARHGEFLRNIGAIAERDRYDLDRAWRALRITLLDYGIFSQLRDHLVFEVPANGRWYYWDGSGKQLPWSADRKERIVCHIGLHVGPEVRQWFCALGGFGHTPVLPPEWLVKKIPWIEAGNLHPKFLGKAKPGDELWEYGMPNELKGPLCDEQGYAIVRDGVPIETLPTLFS